MSRDNVGRGREIFQSGTTIVFDTPTGDLGIGTNVGGQDVRVDAVIKARDVEDFTYAISKNQLLSQIHHTINKSNLSYKERFNHVWTALEKPFIVGHEGSLRFIAKRECIIGEIKRIIIVSETKHTNAMNQDSWTKEYQHTKAYAPSTCLSMILSSIGTLAIIEQAMAKAAATD